MVREAARKFGFVRREVSRGGQVGGETLAATNGEVTWGSDVPRDGGGYVKLARCFNVAFHPTALSPFAEILRQNLPRGLSLVARSV